MSKRLLSTLFIVLFAWLCFTSIWMGLLVLGIVASMVAHEAGHFFAAKKTGMDPYEFFVGFGPVLWERTTASGVHYGIKAIPAGAYVKIRGMERGPEPKDLPTNNRQAFNTASLPKKLVVLLGGVTANFAIGLLLLTGLYATGSNVGLPGTTVESTVESSPAQTALEPGDTIVAINGVNVRTQDEFMLQFVQQKPDSVIELQVKRDNDVITKEVALGHRQEDASVPYLGLLFSTSRVPDNVTLLDAPARGWEDTSAIVTGTASSLGHLVNPVTIYHHLTGVDKDQSTRAVSLIGVTAATDDVVGMVGWAGLIILLANLNLILAFFNALPLMPLDGGHVLVAFIERIKSRKGKPYQLPTKMLASFSGAVMVVLLLLAAVSMYLDIVDPLRL